MNQNCPIPNCPENNKPKREHKNVNCLCDKLLMICLKPGQHLHCPVHPEIIVAKGTDITC